MRHQLQALGFKERHTFKATFERYGFAPNDFDPYKKDEGDLTMLLTDVYVLKNDNFEYVTDHIWVKCGINFERINPQEGDIVQFNARVDTYYKRIKDINERIYTMEYRLVYPTKIKNLTRPDEYIEVETRAQLVARKQQEWAEEKLKRASQPPKMASSAQIQYISSIAKHYKMEDPTSQPMTAKQAYQWFIDIRKRHPHFEQDLKRKQLDEKIEKTKQRNKQLYDMYQQGTTIQELQTTFKLKENTIKGIIRNGKKGEF